MITVRDVHTYRGINYVLTEGPPLAIAADARVRELYLGEGPQGEDPHV